jgi:hypothetical protein
VVVVVYPSETFKRKTKGLYAVDGKVGGELCRVFGRKVEL